MAPPSGLSSLTDRGRPRGEGATVARYLQLIHQVRVTAVITIEVLGGRPAAGPEPLAKVGYLSQDAPVYPGLSVADHLKLGAHLNPGWDAPMTRT